MKTTVDLDAADLRRLKALAEARGRTAAELIRTAVAEYLDAHKPALRPTSVGAGRSSAGTLSERTEDVLSGFGEGPRS